MANLPALTPTTFGEAVQFAEALAKSTMVPREFQMKPANILVAIQWGAELGLGPLQALQNIAVINGKPSVYGDALLALVRGSPLCEDVIEHIDGEGDAREAICQALRKGSSPVVARFSVADAKRAGLWGKAIWQQYPDRMLQMRARGFALRDAFPDILRGVISAEEAADHPRVTPSAAVLGELNANLESALDAFAKSGGVEPDQAETDPLLVTARQRALEGRASFGRWYMDEINDPDRIALRPHIKELQAAARRVDDIEDELPRPQPPAADRPREDLRPQPSPPEGAPTDAEIKGGGAERRNVSVKRLPADPQSDGHQTTESDAPTETKPRPTKEATSAEIPAATSVGVSRGRSSTGETDAEIERSQEMIAAVLGPEELAKLDESAAKAFHEDDIEVVKPKRGAANRGWDWTLYADDLIAAARRVPVDRLGRFRGANSQMINALRTSNKEEWARVNQALADYERETP